MSFSEIVQRLQLQRRKRGRTLRGDPLVRALNICYYALEQGLGLCGVVSLEALVSKPTFSNADARRFRDAENEKELKEARAEYANRVFAVIQLIPSIDDLGEMIDWPKDNKARVRGLYIHDTRLVDGERQPHGFAVVRPIRSELILHRLKPSQAVVFDTHNEKGPITIINSPAETINYLNTHSAAPSRAEVDLVLERPTSLSTRLQSLVGR